MWYIYRDVNVAYQQLPELLEIKTKTSSLPYYNATPTKSHPLIRLIYLRRTKIYRV